MRNKLILPCREKIKSANNWDDKKFDKFAEDFYVYINHDNKEDEMLDGEIYKQPTLQRFWNNEELDY